MSITNTDELRDLLSNEFMKVSKHEMTAASGNACANIAGKILASVKLDLEYYKMIGAVPNIKFLNGDKVKKLK